MGVQKSPRTCRCENAAGFQEWLELECECFYESSCHPCLFLSEFNFFPLGNRSVFCWILFLITKIASASAFPFLFSFRAAPFSLDFKFLESNSDWYKLGQIPTFERISYGQGWKWAPMVGMWCSLYGVFEKYFGNENVGLNGRVKLILRLLTWISGWLVVPCNWIQ